MAVVWWVCALTLKLCALCFPQGLLIEGSAITYKQGLISTSERATITFSNIKMSSDSIEIDKEGVISSSNAHLKTEGLQFFGEKIRKERDKITIERGWFSTCSNEKPHYRLTSGKITIGPRLIKASNIFLKLGNFPIFYVPFYSHPLKSKDFPLSIQAGRSDELGFFVRTKYNYSFQEKRAGFLLDYYKKKGPGFGIDILSDNGGLFGFYNDKRWRLDVVNKRELKGVNSSLIIEKSSDNLVLYDYFKGNIKEKTRSYLMLEKIGQLRLGRLVFEEEDYFSKKISYIPRANFFTTKSFKGYNANLNISGENIRENGYSQNFMINPSISKQTKIGKFPILISTGLKLKDGGYYSISTLLNARLFPIENIKIDIGYSIQKGKQKIPFAIEGFFGKLKGGIDGEFLLKGNKFDNVLFSLKFLKGDLSSFLDGRYENRQFKASFDIGFEKERYGLGLFWLIKERGKDTIVPSILLKRGNFSTKISGHYGDENYLELFIQKAFHCINFDFSINTKKDIRVNLSLK